MLLMPYNVLAIKFILPDINMATTIIWLVLLCIFPIYVCFLHIFFLPLWIRYDSYKQDIALF